MTTGGAGLKLPLADFQWRVRRGSGVRRFSDGLVVQGGRAGELDLRVCRAVAWQAPRQALDLLLPIAAACASEGIRRDTGIVSWLHWPNLVAVDGRVVGRASLSLAAPRRSGGEAHAVLGIWVNCFAVVRHPQPEPLETSILKVMGVEIDLGLLRDKILHALDWYYAEWERGMHRKLAERMRPTISWLGRDVEVRVSGGEVLRGRARGLDDRGSLLLQRRGGGRATGALTLRPGSVELVRELVTKARS